MKFREETDSLSGRAMPADEKHEKPPASAAAAVAAALTSDSGEEKSSSQSSSSVKKRVTIFETKMAADDNNNNSGNIVASAMSKVKIDLKSGRPASASDVAVAGKLPSPTYKVCLVQIRLMNSNLYES